MKYKYSGINLLLDSGLRLGSPASDSSRAELNKVCCKTKTNSLKFFV